MAAATSDRMAVAIWNAADMNADRVEVSWDAEKNLWLIRIEVGAEVIRRHCKESKGADDQTLQKAAEKTAVDEGYQVSPGNISVRR
jgi:hypothetical protein